MAIAMFCPLHQAGELAKATDGHELFIPRSAVMESSAEKREAIHHPYNYILICNQHNINITHADQVKLRQLKCLDVGYKCMGDYAMMSPEKDVMDAGCQMIQSWVDSLGMKTRYNIREMSDL